MSRRILCDDGALWSLRLFRRDIDPRRLLRAPDRIFQRHSRLAFADGICIKKILPQKPADYLRRPVRSQAKREALSTMVMQEMGIKVPVIYGYGINISPFNKYESILFMENILNIGTVKNFLISCSDENKRSKVLASVLNDINTFLKYNQRHKDAHFGNILLLHNLETVWIDNDVKKISSVEDRENFLRKFINNNLLSEKEKQIFIKNIKGIKT